MDFRLVFDCWVLLACVYGNCCRLGGWVRFVCLDGWLFCVVLLLVVAPGLLGFVF